MKFIDVCQIMIRFVEKNKNREYSGKKVSEIGCRGRAH